MFSPFIVHKRVNTDYCKIISIKIFKMCSFSHGQIPSIIINRLAAKALYTPGLGVDKVESDSLILFAVILLFHVYFGIQDTPLWLNLSGLHFVHQAWSVEATQVKYI